jgi:hypothetical protein
LTRGFPRRFSSQKYPKSLPDEEDELYSADKDPMKRFSEKEVAEIKERIRKEGQQMYSIGFAIIGGGFGALMLLLLVKGSPSSNK